MSSDETINLTFDLPLQPKRNVFKIIGVGGAGNNVVNSLYSKKNLEGVDYINSDTDKEAILKSPIENRLQIGTKLTDGLGAENNPELYFK